MSAHPVKLKMVGSYVVAVPKNLPHMKIGDTIRFRSAEKDYEFKVTFKGRWPFKEPRHVVTDSTPLTFGRKGAFDFFCALRPPAQSYPAPDGGYTVSKKKMAWKIYKGKSGGHGSVDPPGRH